MGGLKGITPEKTEANRTIERTEKLKVDELPDKLGECSEVANLPNIIGEVDGSVESRTGYEKNDDKNKENGLVTDTKEIDEKELPERMQPPIEIKFKCPEGLDLNEYERQIKAQENGINNQSVAENMENRKAYQERKETSENGNGRAKEAAEAQNKLREKAYQSRIASNIKNNGMNYAEAKAEASEWIKTKAALHDPDQIAGGNPTKVSQMGDAKVNSSIGGQWKNKVSQLEEAVNNFAKGYTKEELSQINMNVKLEVI